MKLRVSGSVTEAERYVEDFWASGEGRAFSNNADGIPKLTAYDPDKPVLSPKPLNLDLSPCIRERMDPKQGDVFAVKLRDRAPFTGGSTVAGDLRLAMHKFAVARGQAERPTGHRFAWIVNFPLFTPSSESEPGQGGEAGLASTHHPFTAPKSARDLELLRDQPLAATAAHYDLVCNGVELGGGSRRIHNGWCRSTCSATCCGCPASASKTSAT